MDLVSLGEGVSLDVGESSTISQGMYGPAIPDKLKQSCTGKLTINAHTVRSSVSPY